jgi:hypothetical protein
MRNLTRIRPVGLAVTHTDEQDGHKLTLLFACEKKPKMKDRKTVEIILKPGIQRELQLPLRYENDATWSEIPRRCSHGARLLFEVMNLPSGY